LLLGVQPAGTGFGRAMSPEVTASLETLAELLAGVLGSGPTPGAAVPTEES